MGAAHSSGAPAIGCLPRPSVDHQSCSPLLSLPPFIFTDHIWPHLGPAMRAALRTTCRELRQLADSQIGGTLVASVGQQWLEDEAAAQAGSTGSSSESSPPPSPGPLALVTTVRRRSRSKLHWVLRTFGGARHRRAKSMTQKDRPRLPPALCSLMEAAGEVTGLVVGLDVQQLRGPQDKDRFALGAGAVLQRLVGACGHGLLRLDLHCLEAMRPGPELLTAISAAAPGLQQLSLGMAWCQVRGDEVEWEVAVQALPVSLHTLTWTTTGAFWNDGPNVLGAATQLAALRSLTLQVSGWYNALSIEPLAHQLTHLAVGGLDAIVVHMPDLLLACSTSLVSLVCNQPDKLEDEAPGLGLVQRLPYVPGLHSLELCNRSCDLTAEDARAIAGATQLRRLVVRDDKWLAVAHLAGLQPGAWAHLQHLEICRVVKAVDLCLLFGSAVLSQTCTLVLTTQLQICQDAQEHMASTLSQGISTHRLGLRVAGGSSMAPLEGVARLGVVASAMQNPAGDLGSNAVSGAATCTAAVLQALRGLQPSQGLTTRLQAECRAVGEALAARDPGSASAAVQQGSEGRRGSRRSSDGSCSKWLLLAMAHMQVVVLDLEDGCHRELLGLLGPVLAQGWLPSLTRLILRVTGRGTEQHLNRDQADAIYAAMVAVRARLGVQILTMNKRAASMQLVCELRARLGRSGINPDALMLTPCV